MGATWIDGAFYTILGYIQHAQSFFITQARVVAMLCFVMALGMSAVKMALGATDVGKELTKLFLTVITYFVFMWGFPPAMNKLQGIATELAHRAVLTDAIKIDYSDMVFGSEDEFYSYLVEIGGDMWTISGDTSVTAVKRELKFNITNKETGLISLNKMFRLIIITFKAVYASMNVKGVFDAISKLPDAFFVLIVALVYLGALVMCCIQYVSGILEYTYLQAVGVLFIPTMLWDGTKYMYEGMVGAIMKITVKIMIVAMAMYIACVANVEILKNMFVLSAGEYNISQRIEYYVTIIIMSALIKVLCDAAPTIAGFLTGGSPQLSYGEMVQAMKSVGAARNITSGAARVGGSVAGGAMMGLGGSIGQGFKKGAETYKEARSENASAGNALGAAAREAKTSFGESLAGRTSDGLKALENTGSGLGSALSGVGREFSKVVSPTMPLSAEGVGIPYGASGNDGPQGMPADPNGANGVNNDRTRETQEKLRSGGVGTLTSEGKDRAKRPGVNGAVLQNGFSDSSNNGNEGEKGDLENKSLGRIDTDASKYRDYLRKHDRP